MRWFMLPTLVLAALFVHPWILQLGIGFAHGYDHRIPLVPYGALFCLWATVMVSGTVGVILRHLVREAMDW